MQLNLCKRSLLAGADLAPATPDTRGINSLNIAMRTLSYALLLSCNSPTTSRIGFTLVYLYSILFPIFLRFIVLFTICSTTFAPYSLLADHPQYEEHILIYNERRTSRRDSTCAAVSIFSSD